MVELLLKNLTKSYPIEGRSILALNGLSLSVKRRESISIVGPGGCGKTTLIRIIAGLEDKTSGSISCEGKSLSGPNEKVMMVFQSFALLPWKTVLENVELALLPKKITNEERRLLALKYINLVGLEGFEESYPREISSSMKQRVGIARAICMEPKILLMDEPFSSLDPLSANNLRNEILRIYYSRKLKPDVIITVTHNIEEAVIMSDRVIVLSKRPGRVIADIKIDLQRPRNIRDPAFYEYVDKITSLIT